VSYINQVPIRIKQVCKLLKTTKKNLAESAGFSPAVLAGKHKVPSPFTLKKICEYWKIDYDWIQTGQGTPVLTPDGVDVVSPSSMPLMVLPQRPPEKEVIEINQEGGLNGRSVTVDFSCNPKLYFSLLKLSKDMFRSPEQQLLWIVDNFIKEHERT